MRQRNDDAQRTGQNGRQKSTNVHTILQQKTESSATLANALGSLTSYRSNVSAAVTEQEVV